jgi:hypothetical protein
MNNFKITFEWNGNIKTAFFMAHDIMDALEA